MDSFKPTSSKRDNVNTAAANTFWISSKDEEARAARELANQDSPLLRLPPELRKMIYDEIILQGCAHIPLNGRHGNREYSKLRVLFHLCRVVRAETESTWWSMNRFHLAVSHLFGGGGYARAQKAVLAMSDAAVASLRDISFSSVGAASRNPYCDLTINVLNRHASIRVWEEWEGHPDEGTITVVLKFDEEEEWSSRLGEWMRNFNAVDSGEEESCLTREDIEYILECMNALAMESFASKKKKKKKQKKNRRL